MRIGTVDFYIRIGISYIIPHIINVSLQNEKEYERCGFIWSFAIEGLFFQFEITKPYEVMNA